MKPPSLPARYTVRPVLGAGASGRVYCVHDSIRDLDLALKLVSRGESAWLRREFDTLRQIRHENLIQVFDWGTLESGEAYYTMELIHGEDWGGRMSAPQSADEVRRILTGLLRGLAHLHCHGEIHGDIKPGNVLLGEGGLVKVTDVGMRGASGDVSRQSGTPGYAAPEIWEGKEADVRSDLYSVGVMAYEALTGQHPFAGRTVREVISGQLEGWVASPAAHGVRVPADLDRVVMRAIERNPALRQGGADEFMEGMGVEDRVGEILGGRFVDREEQLAEIEDLFHARTGRTATLVHIIGPAGSGKSALLEEVAHRTSAAGIRTIRLASAWHSINQIVALLDGGTPVSRSAESGIDIASVAEHLIAKAAETPILVGIDPTDEQLSRIDVAVKSLARYLWALSIERKSPARILLVITRQNASAQLDEFERQEILEPFHADGSAEQIRATLGRCTLSSNLFNRLYSLTGGLPGPTMVLLDDLVGQGLLQRSDLGWKFRETEETVELVVPKVYSRWERAWPSLSVESRRILCLLALAPDGIDEGTASFRHSHDSPAADLSRLETKGWTRTHSGRWRLASDAIHKVVTDCAGPLFAETARSLLKDGAYELSDEERVDIQLITESTTETLQSGLLASTRAAQRGDQHKALERLQACRAIALTLADEKALNQIAFQLAEAFHRLGKEGDALEALSARPSSDPGANGIGFVARTEHLAGTIHGSMGDTDLARGHLERAIRLAEEIGDQSLLVRSHADLAELDWRHGGEASRRSAIRRIRQVLETLKADPALADERAALTYSLGSALIVSGEATAAQDVLASGLAEPTSDHWRARLSNALGAAFGVVSRSTEAMHWYDEAWRYAERSNTGFLKSRILSNKAAILYSMGRLRESIDFDRQAGNWARRLGNRYEYVAACAGTTITLIRQAEYEEALHEARETFIVAQKIPDDNYMLRGLELEALALSSIGDYQNAKEVLKRADQVSLQSGRSLIDPRFDWLWGRLHGLTGQFAEAERLLREAEKQLLVSMDLEDLLGVQIELRRLLCTQQTALDTVSGICNIVSEAREKRVLVAELSGALLLAEVLSRFGLDHRDYSQLLTDALGRAESADFVEIAWQLSYWTGVLAERAGDIRTRHARFNHSVRIIREVVARLTPEHRQTYLGSPHVRSTLDAMVLTK